MADMKMKSRASMDFCPSCIGFGKEAGGKFRLDKNRLGYQIVVQSENTNMGELLKNTVLQNDAGSLLKAAPDPLFQKQFGEENKPICYLGPDEMQNVLSKIKGEDGGIAAAENEPASSDGRGSAPEDGNARTLKAGARSRKPLLSLTDKMDSLEAEEVTNGNEAGCIKIYKKGSLILQAYPCCPSCHVVLPQGWFDADRYVDIGLVAPSLGGKTTFMTTLAKDNWLFLSDWIARCGYENVTVDSANISEEILEPGFYYMLEEAEKMDVGLCPGGTPPKYGKRKIYIAVTVYKDETRQERKNKYIVGIADIAGELLQTMGRIEGKGAFVASFPYCDGYIYLVEPEMIDDYKKSKYSIKNDEDKKSTVQAKLLEIKEQGKLQAEQPQIRALDVEINKNSKKYKAFDLYNILVRGIQKKNGVTPMQNRAFALAMTKCDLLKEYLIAKDPRYNMLFHPDENIDLSVAGYLDNVHKKEKDALATLLPSMGCRDVERKFPKRSYHVISPLGRKTEKVDRPDGDTDYYMVEMDEFDDLGPHPIRVAEPLFGCMLSLLDF